MISFTSRKFTSIVLIASILILPSTGYSYVHETTDTLAINSGLETSDSTASFEHAGDLFVAIHNAYESYPNIFTNSQELDSNSAEFRLIQGLFANRGWLLGQPPAIKGQQLIFTVTPSDGTGKLLQVAFTPDASTAGAETILMPKGAVTLLGFVPQERTPQGDGLVNIDDYPSARSISQAGKPRPGSTAKDLLLKVRKPENIWGNVNISGNQFRTPPDLVLLERFGDTGLIRPARAPGRPSFAGDQLILMSKKDAERLAVDQANLWTPGLPWSPVGLTQEAWLDGRRYHESLQDTQGAFVGWQANSTNAFVDLLFRHVQDGQTLLEVGVGTGATAEIVLEEANKRNVHINLLLADILPSWPAWAWHGLHQNSNVSFLLLRDQHDGVNGRFLSYPQVLGEGRTVDWYYSSSALHLMPEKALTKLAQQMASTVNQGVIWNSGDFSRYDMPTDAALLHDLFRWIKIMIHKDSEYKKVLKKIGDEDPTKLNRVIKKADNIFPDPPPALSDIDNIFHAAGFNQEVLDPQIYYMSSEEALKFILVDRLTLIAAALKTYEERKAIIERIFPLAWEKFKRDGKVDPEKGLRTAWTFSVATLPDSQGDGLSLEEAQQVVLREIQVQTTEHHEDIGDNVPELSDPQTPLLDYMRPHEIPSTVQALAERYELAVPDETKMQRLTNGTGNDLIDWLHNATVATGLSRNEAQQVVLREIQVQTTEHHEDIGDNVPELSDPQTPLLDYMRPHEIPSTVQALAQRYELAVPDETKMQQLTNGTGNDLIDWLHNAKRTASGDGMNTAQAALLEKATLALAATKSLLIEAQRSIATSRLASAIRRIGGQQLNLMNFLRQLVLRALEVRGVSDAINPSLLVVSDVTAAGELAILRTLFGNVLTTSQFMQLDLRSTTASSALFVVQPSEGDDIAEFLGFFLDIPAQTWFTAGPFEHVQFLWLQGTSVLDTLTQLVVPGGTPTMLLNLVIDGISDFVSGQAA